MNTFDRREQTHTMNPELVERVLEPVATKATEALIDEISMLLGRPKQVAESAKRLLLDYESGLGGADLGAGSLKASDQAEIKISQGIPATQSDTYLPPGIHVTSWPELVQHYSSDPNRAKFLDGMLHGLHDLRDAGIDEVYLGGSYVRSFSVIPNDFDVTFEGQFSKSMPTAQAKVLNDRALMNKAYGGDLLEGHFDYFTNSYGGKTNAGILQIDMTTLARRPSEVSPAVKVYDAWKTEKPFDSRDANKLLNSDFGYIKSWMIEPAKSSRSKLSSK